MPPSTTQNYDYTTTGIDNFLSRSIDQVSWQASLETVLNMPGYGTLTTLPPNAANNATRFDSTQTTGTVGDSIQVGGGSNGGVTISNSSIIANDGSNDFLIIGSDGSSSGTSG